MKLGIILAREHGGRELTALGPTLPYHEATARFKKEFQSGDEDVHSKYEEVVLVPVESSVSKRVRFVTESRAAELVEIHARAHEAAKRAASLSDEIKAAMADVSDARNQVEHFERALVLAEKNNNPEDRAKSVAVISDRLETAKSNLEQCKAALKKAEAKDKKADAEVDSKAEAKTPKKQKTQ